MKKITLTVLFSLVLSGCSSSKFGHSLEEWDSMTRQQRNEAKTRAENMVEYAQEKQLEKEFLYQPVNVIFGSRSNVYGSKINLY